jgi:uncharacterized protein YerC
MVNISKRKLKQKIRESISTQLVHHIARVHGDSRTRNFLAELLTDAEETQLAKRFSAIILLMRGYSFRQIERILKISPATAVKLWRQYKSGKFKTIRSISIWQGKAFQVDTALESLLKLLTEGLPPRAGKGRWKFLKGV